MCVWSIAVVANLPGGLWTTGWQPLACGINCMWLAYMQVLFGVHMANLFLSGVFVCLCV